MHGHNRQKRPCPSKAGEPCNVVIREGSSKNHQVKRVLSQSVGGAQQCRRTADVTRPISARFSPTAKMLSMAASVKQSRAYATPVSVMSSVASRICRLCANITSCGGTNRKLPWPRYLRLWDAALVSAIEHVCHAETVDRAAERVLRDDRFGCGGSITASRMCHSGEGHHVKWYCSGTWMRNRG